MSQERSGWHLMETNAAGGKRADDSTPNIVKLPSDWTYLAHWTRRIPGPWPDQSEADFLDELILGMPQKDRSALATLARIVAGETLIAVSNSNRTDLPTVSFTGLPLHDWPQRVYRKHRSRWDFEPYGICIEKQWLVDRGTRRLSTEAK